MSQDLLFTVIDSKTGKIPDLHQISAHEGWASEMSPEDIHGLYVFSDGKHLVLVDDYGTCAFPPEGRFEVIWNKPVD